jgi:hypothetical protein
MEESNVMQARDRRFKGNKTYDIRRMWEQHHEIIRQVVLGRTNVAIAADMDLTPQTISNVRNNPVAQQVIATHMVKRDESVADIVRQMEAFSPVAEKLLEDIISGKMDASLSLRAKYADKHLGRTGYGEVRKIQSLHGTLTKDDIDDLKDKALAAAREAGMVVDVDYECQN